MRETWVDKSMGTHVYINNNGGKLSDFEKKQDYHIILCLLHTRHFDTYIFRVVSNPKRIHRPDEGAGMARLGRVYYEDWYCKSYQVKLYGALLKCKPYI